MSLLKITVSQFPIENFSKVQININGNIKNKFGSITKHSGISFVARFASVSHLNAIYPSYNIMQINAFGRSGFLPRLSISVVVLFRFSHSSNATNNLHWAAKLKCQSAWNCGDPSIRNSNESEEAANMARKCICIIISFYLKISQVVTVDKKKIK